jgi:gluconolactonase
MKYDVVATGLRFPEGPVWCEDGSIVLVEIEAGRLTRIEADGTLTTIATPGGSPNGAAIADDGCCYVCNSGGFAWHEDEHGLRPAGIATDYSGGRIERINLDTGAVDLLYDRTDVGMLRGPNDLVLDDHGGFWFTDPGKTRDRKSDQGSVFYARIDGSMIVEAAFPLLRPNGIGLSPDGKKLYVAETPTSRLWEFDIEAPGKLGKRPWPSPHGGNMVANAGGYSLLDSLAVDRAGRIWIATLFNGGLAVVSPDGSKVRHIPLPDPYVTNICFGGHDMNTAFVTMSRSGQLISFDVRQIDL